MYLIPIFSYQPAAGRKMSACRAVSLIRVSIATIVFAFAKRVSRIRCPIRLCRSTFPKIETITSGPASPRGGASGKCPRSSASFR
jgi:hypothetical protein